MGFGRFDTTPRRRPAGPRRPPAVTRPGTRQKGDDPSLGPNFGRSTMEGEQYAPLESRSKAEQLLDSFLQAKQGQSGHQTAADGYGQNGTFSTWAQANGGDGPPSQGPGGYGGDLDTDNQWDGFASRYNQGQWNWLDAPNILAKDFLSSIGQGNNLGAEGMLVNWADLALPLYNLLNGGAGVDDAVMGDDDIINWIAEQFLPGLSTPGAGTYSADQLMNLLYDYADDKSGDLYASLFLNDDGSTKMLSQQIDALNNYMQLVGNFMNPMAATANMAQMNRLLNDYKSKNAKGEALPDIVQYLKQNGFMR